MEYCARARRIRLSVASLSGLSFSAARAAALVVLLLRPTSCLRAPPRSGSYFIRLEESLACPKYCCKSNRTASLAHRSFDCCTGFCAACTELRPKASHVFGIRSEVSIAPKANGGMSAAIGATVHCVAVEPHATFVRVSIQDNGQEVAYETAVLGRLRFGYRVFLLRSSFGTRIELAYLFVLHHLWGRSEYLAVCSASTGVRRKAARLFCISMLFNSSLSSNTQSYTTPGLTAPLPACSWKSTGCVDNNPSWSSTQACQRRLQSIPSSRPRTCRSDKS
jgi:hypothetical protein